MQRHEAEHGEGAERNARRLLVHGCLLQGVSPTTTNGTIREIGQGFDEQSARCAGAISDRAILVLMGVRIPHHAELADDALVAGLAVEDSGAAIRSSAGSRRRSTVGAGGDP